MVGRGLVNLRTSVVNALRLRAIPAAARGTLRKEKFRESGAISTDEGAASAIGSGFADAGCGAARCARAIEIKLVRMPSIAITMTKTAPVQYRI